eukprot:UN02661
MMTILARDIAGSAWPRLSALHWYRGVRDNAETAHMKSVSVIKPRSNELQSDPMIEDSKGLPMPKSRLRSLLGGVYMEAVFKEKE